MQFLRARTIAVTASIILSGVMTGCGGGGGTTAVASNVSSNASSDTNANSATGSSGSVPTGCTITTFNPNYANLMPLYRWGSLPVKIYFLNSGMITASDGTQVDLQQIALQGFSEWSSATNGAISLQVTTDAAQANITVHFGALAAAPTAKDVLGLEQSRLFVDNTIKSADILLNTWPSMSAANVNSFRETATHEFGHALGINGHSDFPLDVMYAAHSVLVEKPLSARDINTLRTGYCNEFSRQALPRGNEETHVISNN